MFHAIYLKQYLIQQKSNLSSLWYIDHLTCYWKSLYLGQDICEIYTSYIFLGWHIYKHTHGLKAQRPFLLLPNLILLTSACIGVKGIVPD